MTIGQPVFVVDEAAVGGEGGRADRRRWTYVNAGRACAHRGAFGLK
jgi:hypothetical protein